MKKPAAPPSDASSYRYTYRVPFYDTDGMGIVHHANYVKYLELARVSLLDQVGLPYRTFLARGLSFAVTRCEVSYKRPARFDDDLEIQCWMTWLRAASLGLAYVVRCGDDTLATGVTEHAMVNEDGRPRRIPAEFREVLKKLGPERP